ncbi:protein FMC1 homolog isoform X2 [Dermacentor andersoni]|uniref:protein FMC1 homolog isoform X2 n=1 Tax=Dermacentor andersoni TaxID=34620 RepID=UPI003B3B0D0C
MMQRMRGARGGETSLLRAHRPLIRCTWKPVRGTLAARYLLSEARKHQTTEKRLCRAHQELQAKMDTYCTYLASSRKEKALHLQYHARGERSVEESAHLVGLSVPKPFDNSQDR